MSSRGSSRSSVFVNQILICELQKISRVSVNNGVISSPGLISSCSFLPVINVFFFFVFFFIPLFRGVSPPLCDVETDLSSRWRLEYDVYQYFLPENDLSERSLLSGVETVAGAPSMLQNGRKVERGKKYSCPVPHCSRFRYSFTRGNVT